MNTLNTSTSRATQMDTYAARNVDMRLCDHDDCTHDLPTNHDIREADHACLMARCVELGHHLGLNVLC